MLRHRRTLVSRVLYVRGSPAVVPAPSIIYLSRVGSWAVGWLTLDGEQVVLHLNRRNAARWFEVSGRGVTPFVVVSGNRRWVEEPSERLVLELLDELDYSRVEVMDGAEVPPRSVRRGSVAGVKCTDGKKYIVFRTRAGEVDSPASVCEGGDYEERRVAYLLVSLGGLVAVNMVVEGERLADTYLVAVGEAPSKVLGRVFKIALAVPKRWTAVAELLEPMKRSPVQA